jgi:TetR/AcrR family transcriptional regulator, tetracycline repressor protein
MKVIVDGRRGDIDNGCVEQIHALGEQYQCQHGPLPVALGVCHSAPLPNVNNVHGEHRSQYRYAEGSVKRRIDLMVLRKANVVDGALALLDAEGLDGITMRKLGVSLGVKAGALYRHFPSKEALLDAMAERLLEGVGDPLPDSSWDEQLAELARRFRAALLSRRDGARVVAGTFVTEPNTNAAGAVAVRALCAAGVPVEKAGWIAFAGMYYVLGHTIEEQAMTQLVERDEWQARSVQPSAEDPLFAEAVRSVFAADVDDRFAHGLDLFISGIRQQLQASQ